MDRQVLEQVRGYPTQDGAGVQLCRVLGPQTAEVFDPILMLDSFDSNEPEDYQAGFPLHPHRGIETISYVLEGCMEHRDSLGHQDAVGDGELQWMTAGSGILHEERLPARPRLLGVQVWLNLPRRDKLCQPSYHHIGKEQISVIPFPGGRVHLLAGKYQDQEGFMAEHLPLNYYDVELEPGAEWACLGDHEQSLMLFTLLGEAEVQGQRIGEKTAVKLSAGERLSLRNPGSQTARVLYLSSRRLGEPIAWGGPVVMNSRAELEEAFRELEQGRFLKSGVDYSSGD